MDFCHLHCHSEMSLLDGMSRVSELPRRARELGMSALALTDHGVLSGAVDFTAACRDEGVKPILGAEGYLARRGHLDKEPRLDDQPYHLLMLAESQIGYRNLVQLVSTAWTAGFYYRPRVDKELLAAHQEGLIVTSGCLSGEIPSLILAGQVEQAWQSARWYRDVFGPERFLIELMDHGLEDELRVRPHLLEMAQRLDLKLIATQDAHYLYPEDARAHDILLCIQTAKTVNQPDRMRYPNGSFYLKSPQEMARLFAEIPQAVTNTLAIAERCQASPGWEGAHAPDFVLPAGETAKSHLHALVASRLPERYANPSAQVLQRLDDELAVISGTGFESYFLITADFVDFARRQGIAVGPGRGSAPGSVVAYVLGITDIDPIAYHLLFERFLNPERISPPDIDIDFDYTRRDEVIRYVRDRYGEDRVAHIITFGTLAARAAIRDVARALEVPYAEADRMAKLVPAELGITLERALDLAPELMSMAHLTPQLSELFEIARKLEGMPRHASVHAAGIVIAPGPLNQLVPLQKMTDGTVVTQFTMTALEEIGLLKMDFLGLRTLTVIDQAVRQLQAAGAPVPDRGQMPLDDAATLRLLGEADTYGVFQMESDGMRQLLRDLRPSGIEDVIAAVSLYRPGPMENIKLFLQQKHSGAIHYLHPDLAPILADTYGVIVYQEQVMEVAAVMAGYTLAEADLLRRAMGKKKAEILIAERAKFVQGCLGKGHPLALAESLYDLIFRFANYGFNRAHGASYGLLAYQTAFLKAHHPAAYLAAHLTSLAGNEGKVAEGLADLAAHQVAVLAPDVNHSQVAFSTEGPAVRVGLLAVKNLGEQAAAELVAERGSGYRSLFDLLARLPSLNRRAAESLIRAGALDALGTRSQHLAALAPYMDEVARRRRRQSTGQIGLFEEAEASEPTLPPVPAQSDAERLAGEQDALGFFLSGHPLDAFGEEIAIGRLTTVSRLGERRDGERVSVAGVIDKVRTLTTKKGEPMARLTLSDRFGQAQAVVFPQAMAKAGAFLEGGLAVQVTGRVEHQEEESTILVEQIEALAKEPELIVAWDPEAARESLLQVLSACAGRSPVVLSWQGEETRLPDVRVDVGRSLLTTALEKLIGPGGFSVRRP
ncbi:MAG: DNA polymerase III subunit alpha [Sulfobacillus sp.]